MTQSSDVILERMMALHPKVIFGFVQKRQIAPETVAAQQQFKIVKIFLRPLDYASQIFVD